jgi:hypothetical protein
MSENTEKTVEKWGVSYRGTLYPGFGSFKEADDYIDVQPGWRETGAVARPLAGDKDKKGIVISHHDRTGLAKEIESLAGRIERRARGAKKIKSEKLLQVLPPIEAISDLKKAVAQLLELYFVADEFQAWQKLKLGNKSIGG